MDPNRLMLAQDEFNAHMLRGVMGATGQPGETAEDLQTRCAAIVELFRTFEVANPMEAMIACHCISLRFMLDAAMRDAGAADLELAMLIRLRASAMAIGKNLHLWMANFASLHARNEARAAEVRQRANQPEAVATPARPQPTAMQSPPRRPEQPRPIAAQVAKVTAPFVAPPAVPDQSPLRLGDLPAQSMKRGLLSSAAVSLSAPSNGRLNAPTPPPTT
ncbi:MAG: hypothetical protein ABSE20_22325 [Acetobacteraceae bacterium]|jgi:hypothetical protein